MVVYNSLLQVEDAPANVFTSALCPCKLGKEVAHNPVVNVVQAGLATCCSISHQLL
jgi:hypothetical protein